MLRLSKKADYALLAMRQLAAQPQGAVVSARELAEEYAIPPDLLAKVLQKLVRARLLVSQQPDVVVILCSTYDAGDLPREVATSGARAYLNKEHLGADTLRELWSHRDTKEFTSA